MAFTRQRIEAWCEDVAQYLRDGTICHNVTGYLETTQSEHSTADLFISKAEFHKSSSHLQLQTKNADSACRTSSAESNGTSMLIAKDSPTNNDYNRNKKVPFWSKGGGIYANPSRVKSACDLHQEQQRKIKYLVQSLPVEPTSVFPQEARSLSKTSPNKEVPIFLVQRKRSTEVGQSRPRSSSQPRFRHYKSNAVYAQTIFGSNGNLLRDFNLRKPHDSSMIVWTGSRDQKILLRQGSIADILYTQRLNSRSQDIYHVIQKY